MRTHMILPDELVKDIDKFAGRRKRSHFVEEAVREKLGRDRLLAALEETAGILSAKEYPDWATTEKAAAWVRESRREDIKRLRKLPHG